MSISPPKHLRPLVLASALLVAPVLASAADPAAPGIAPVAAVAVTGVASTTVANDRMQVTLRAETDAPTAAAAASEVNARMAVALERARAVAGVEARSAGYSTYPVSEKGKPTRWRVVQSLALEGSDFGALATLATRLQDDGLLLSSMVFSVKPETRRKAEDAVTQQAIRAWQQRAELAATALGYAGWRPGHVVVSTQDFAPPTQMFRAQAAAAPPVAPVAVEGGTTDITVTVSGEAILDRPTGR